MSTNLEIEHAFMTGAAAVLGKLREVADTLSAAHHLDNATTAHKLAERVQGALGGPRATVSEVDGRTSRWRCRFRIYDARNMDEPIADSDEELSAELPGSQVLAGLPGVAAEVQALAQGFHTGKVLVGLSREELTHRLKSVRPTLSRNDGAATWRVPYRTLEATGSSILARQTGQGTTERNWLMRVDIVREETGK